MVWYALAALRLRISWSISANVTGTATSSTIKQRLYSSVFLVMVNASLVENRNSKFLNPTHGLFKKLLMNPPPEMWKFLNAISTPSIGRNENSKNHTSVGVAMIISSRSSLVSRFFFFT